MSHVLSIIVFTLFVLAFERAVIAARDWWHNRNPENDRAD